MPRIPPVSGTPSRLPRRWLFGAAATSLLLPGCVSTTRLDAVPRGRFHQASVLGLPNERFFYTLNAAPLAAEFTAALERWDRSTGLAPGATPPPLHMLSISGGGEDGAFGAGLLCGMTAAGTRPVYNLVTGVSTGALTAPFAFLGSAYDGASARRLYQHDNRRHRRDPLLRQRHLRRCADATPRRCSAPSPAT